MHRRARELLPLRPHRLLTLGLCCADLMADPKTLLQDLKGLTGVVEVGLFVGMAQEAFFGHEVGRQFRPGCRYGATG